jgi:cytochrome c oxidase subunit 2
VTIFNAGSRGDLAAAWLLWMGMLGGAHSADAASPPRPAEFDICQGCHGVNGQGNAELGAPRIAGLDAQYIGRQLANFRDGRRGTSDDVGAQMRTIAAMLDDTTIGRLSAYIGSMPETAVSHTIDGDRRAGQAAYATCAACHGSHAEGNAVLGGPRLAGMSDWYLTRQFAAFASGQRGTAAGDEHGATMRAIAATVKGERAVRDVIAYAVSLQTPAAAMSKECADREAGACAPSR